MLAERTLSLQQIYQLGPGFTSVIRGLKCAMNLTGLCLDRMADPMRPCTPEQRRKISEYLRDLHPA